MKPLLKKPLSLAFLFILLTFFTTLSFSPLANAKTTPGEAVKQQLGFNPEDIPTSPQDIKDKYLSQEWSSLIAKNQYLGPVHNTFVSNPLIFKILFGDPYAISLTFLVIVILWLFIGAKAGQLFEGSGILKGVAAVVAGFVFTILLAQTTLLRTLAKLCLDVITNSANWWIRFIAFIFLVFLFFILSYLISLIRKSMIANRAAKKEEKRDARDEELKAFTKGIRK